MLKTLERRKRNRSRSQLPQALLVTKTSKSGEIRTFAAKVIDFTEEGLGVEMFVPLTVGSIVTLDGRFRSKDLALGLEGRARVVHSRKQREGNYRVGLRMEEVAYRRPA